MQFNFGWRTFWKCLRTFSKRFKWILARTIFWKLSKTFRENAIEFHLHSNLDPSWKSSDHIQWNFDWDTIGSCLRTFSMRWKWSSAKTQLGNVSDYFQKDAIELGLWIILDRSWNNFDQVQLIFGWNTILKTFGKISIRWNRILAKTQIGHSLVWFPSDGTEFWPWNILVFS